MVKGQLIARGITDSRVLAAFRKIPRHRFVEPRLAAHAYEDHPLEIGFGQTISQPFMVAYMLQALGLVGGERVLEVGTGSGYETALLASLAQEIFSCERIPELAASAEKILKELGIANVSLRVGDGSRGWPEEAPFDAIIVSCAAPQVPQTLMDELSVGGRLGIPIGDASAQDFVLVERTAQGLKSKQLGGCVFVPLVGEAGFR
ncbi:MAG: protein-L-isoaspartate(D-aspartate) O-methyltransferase [Candidatus Omnitrophica bacterium]|nr:protein-L-isoaspartate(D-aspartate) O-methyltransferase [Candidatus Omnitrophota bacterium]